MPKASSSARTIFASVLDINPCCVDAAARAANLRPLPSCTVSRELLGCDNPHPEGATPPTYWTRPWSDHTAIDEIRSQWRLMTVYERFEQIVAITLSGVIAIVIVISLIQLIRLVFTLLVMDALNPLDHQVFQLVFGAIMTMLIAMEFKHSIVKVALRKESIIQVKTVILIAILALARKFIIIEPDVAPAKVAALAGTVLALGLTYWLMRERDDRMIE